MTYEFRHPTAEDVTSLAATMRPCDVQEVWAWSKHTPYQAVRRSVEVSRDTWAVRKGSTVLCIFGCAEPARTAILPVGQPWMLGSCDLVRHSKALLHYSKPWVDQLRETYGHLFNHVDARNHSAIRWLKWLGFTIEAPQPAGVNGEPFHLFWAGGTKHV